MVRRIDYGSRMSEQPPISPPPGPPAGPPPGPPGPVPGHPPPYPQGYPGPTGYPPPYAGPHSPPPYAYPAQPPPYVIAPPPGPVHPGYGPPLSVLARPAYRLYARLVDFGLLLVLFFALLWTGLATAGDDSGERGANVLWSVWFALGYLLLYDPLAHWLTGGRTLGKWLLGLRVVRLRDGGRVGLLRGIGREWSYLFGTLFAGFIAGAGVLVAAWCLWDAPFKQGLHEKLADTVVIGTRPGSAVPLPPAPGQVR